MFVFCFRCKITRTGNSQQENPKIKKTILITTKMAVFLFQRASNRELFGVSVSETVATLGALEGGARAQEDALEGRNLFIPFRVSY